MKTITEEFKDRYLRAMKRRFSKEGDQKYLGYETPEDVLVNMVIQAFKLEEPDRISEFSKSVEAFHKKLYSFVNSLSKDDIYGGVDGVYFGCREAPKGYKHGFR